MSTDQYQLAIETSGRIGSFALACGDELIEVITLPPPTGGAGTGGSSQLMQHLDALCIEHAIKPAQLTEVYLSIGPGSFTGLRVSVTLAKMFALTLGTKVIAVPTLDVLARNAPEDVKYVAVGLNLKKETLYTGLYQRDGEAMNAIAEPALRTMSELLAIAPRPLVILGDPLPALPADAGDVIILPQAMAHAKAEHVWQLGGQASREGRFDDPMTLVPLYVRPPEAIEIWDRIHGKA